MSCKGFNKYVKLVANGSDSGCPRLPNLHRGLVDRAPDCRCGRRSVCVGGGHLQRAGQLTSEIPDSGPRSFELGRN